MPRGRAALPGILMIVLTVTACTRRTTEPPAGTITICKEQQASWIRNFNPLAPGTQRWPTKYGIYEPLMIYSSGTGEWAPWLATAWAYSDDLMTLDLTLRESSRSSFCSPIPPWTPTAFGASSSRSSSKLRMSFA